MNGAGGAGGSGGEGSTLWHGRFEGGPDAALMAYTVSLPFDRRLWHDDIVGSRAHVGGLARVGLLTEVERDEVLAALDQVHSELSEGRFEYVASDEDIHTAVERRVTEIAGPSGAKLHTARSRNDQVATDLRLWCKRELVEVARGLYDLQQVLLTRAIEAGQTYLPGYTHLQRAQPVLLSHHLLAHGWAFGRDIDRLLATVDRLDVSPLGAGALAGTSLPIDPEGNAAELGFARAFDNSLDVVSDRDFVAEALFDLALIGVHLSRIGEEWVLWTTEEFGFARLDDGFATGSSMLPQKKNPDIAELARGKAGRLIGNLTALLATLKGLPLAYNRDLQEDKEGLFDSVDQVNLAVAALTGMIATATFVPERDAGRRRCGRHRGDRPRRVPGARRHSVPGRPRDRWAAGSPPPGGRWWSRRVGGSGDRCRRGGPGGPRRRRPPAHVARRSRAAGGRCPAGALSRDARRRARRVHPSHVIVAVGIG